MALSGLCQESVRDCISDYRAEDYEADFKHLKIRKWQGKKREKRKQRRIFTLLSASSSTNSRTNISESRANL
jgi:hypothetical protein